MQIQFLCNRVELNRERRGYFDALVKKGVSPESADNSNILATGPLVSSTEARRAGCVLFPDPPTSTLPTWLARCVLPTVCFQIDTFVKPKWRALWSTLFDYVVVFHPGYEHYFTQYGHQRVLVLPHAVDGLKYAGNESTDRPFEVGWIGRADGPLYETRRQILPTLSGRYKLNDWQRNYAEDEAPDIYRASRIVVNIARDDHPQDANLRCFEAMAAGSLLITKLPSELEQLGFRAGQHFIGYHEPGDLTGLIDSQLGDPSQCRNITNRARELVLRQHTYVARVSSLLAALSADGGRKFAPARNWSEARINYVYLHYFCKRSMLKEAKAEFRKLLTLSPSLAMRGYPWLVRCSQLSRDQGTDI